MGSKELGCASSSDGRRTPCNVLATPTDDEHAFRKNLVSHFLESDERHGFGGFPGGTTPVDVHGNPIADLSRTGGWVAAFFIFGNEMTERMAYFGLAVNMVQFLFKVMHQPFTISANVVNNFLGISQASSIIGGFIADAYLGRYWTIAIFTTLYLAGLTGITLCATMRIFVPSQVDCDGLAQILGTCQQPKHWQTTYLYTILYITAFGAAGIRPCVSSFGADQFNERSKNYKKHLDRFFNFFYLAVTVGAVAAFTMVVYVQIHHGWGAAFGVLAIAMGISNILFFVGTPLYRHRLPGGSPLTRVAQVLVAAFHKRNVPYSCSEFIGLYEVSGKGSAIKGSCKIPHTDDFRFLDKAALSTKEDGPNPSPWKLCTVTQVEEVKILIKLLPIPSCTIMLGAVLTEFLTLSVQQAYTMNTHLGNLKLPVTCMPVFPGLAIFALISLYYSIFVPIARRITGHPRGVSQLQRVGIGLLLSIFSVGWAGGFERYRRNYAVGNGFEFNFLTGMPHLSAYWLLIQYCFIGLAEVFCIVGLLEFLYQESPDATRSIASSYAAVAGGLGCFVATIINNIVQSLSPKITSIQWLNQNINLGRFDYFYWFLTVLSLLNFGVFVYLAGRYKYRYRPELEVENFESGT